MHAAKPMVIFLCGDVMTGRGIDQVLAHPGNPGLYESHVRDAREYVTLAERVNGPIPRPVEDTYIWGDALERLLGAAIDVRIINLETSITTSNDHWRGKPVLYRMHPENIGCLKAARIDCCCLANNHVLDWGYPGLVETLDTLKQADIHFTGAGENEAAAALPFRFEIGGKGRVVFFAFGSDTSGIPENWRAAVDRPGVNFLPDLSRSTARRIARGMMRAKEPGDVILASLHWGSNWGYEVTPTQIDFAHGLIDEGVSIVHGHSSHHVRPVEVYRDRLILYGCGDFITDYEGIGGYEEFRGDFSLMYLVTVDAADGRLIEARLVPMQLRRFRLHDATTDDARWLCNLLGMLGTPFRTQVGLNRDNTISLSGG